MTASSCILPWVFDVHFTLVQDTRVVSIQTLIITSRARDSSFDIGIETEEKYPAVTGAELLALSSVPTIGK
jgi:hypothetical protein